MKCDFVDTSMNKGYVNKLETLDLFYIVVFSGFGAYDEDAQHKAIMLNVWLWFASLHTIICPSTST